MKRPAVRQVLAEELDRERILKENSCAQAGAFLLGDAIWYLLADEDARAMEILDTAEFYLLTAIERNDLGIHGTTGQIDLGRSERLKDLTIVQWIRSGRLDADSFREACEIKAEWNRQVFSLDDWEEINLHEWMAEQIILGEYLRARELKARYGNTPLRRAEADALRPEEVLDLVAASLLSPANGALREQAEEALDRFYSGFTDWPNYSRSPEQDLLFEQKVLYAYIRGRFFKGVEDPIRLIKMMKYGE